MTDGSYVVVLTVLNDIINMQGSTPDQTWLAAHKPEVDRDIDNTFTPIIDLIPFITGATNDLILIANARLGAMWFARNKDYSSQKYWDGLADKKTQSVKDRAKALPKINKRTAAFAAGADPRYSKMPLPCQSSIFVFDQFA